MSDKELTPFQQAKKDAIDAGFDAEEVESLRSQKDVEELMASRPKDDPEFGPLDQQNVQNGGGFPTPPRMQDLEASSDNDPLKIVTHKGVEKVEFEVTKNRHRIVNVVKSS